MNELKGSIADIFRSSSMLLLALRAVIVAILSSLSLAEETTAEVSETFPSFFLLSRLLRLSLLLRLDWDARLCLPDAVPPGISQGELPRL